MEKKEGVEILIEVEDGEKGELLWVREKRGGRFWEWRRRETESVMGEEERVSEGRFCIGRV